MALLPYLPPMCQERKTPSSWRSPKTLLTLLPTEALWSAVILTATTLVTWHLSSFRASRCNETGLLFQHPGRQRSPFKGIPTSHFNRCPE